MEIPLAWICEQKPLLTKDLSPWSMPLKLTDRINVTTYVDQEKKMKTRLLRCVENVGC